MVANSDKAKIYEETGCLFPCENFAYELRPLRPLERDHDIFLQYFDEFEHVSDILNLEFTIMTGNYMEFEQVRV